MRNGAAKVGTPLPKVVVDVNRGNAGGADPALERCEAYCHRLSLLDEYFRAGKGEVVDDIDEEERRAIHGHRNRSLLAPGWVAHGCRCDSTRRHCHEREHVAYQPATWNSDATSAVRERLRTRMWR